MKASPFLLLCAALGLAACATPEERARANHDRRARNAAEQRRRAAEDLAEDRRRAAEKLRRERDYAVEDAARLRIYEEEYAHSLGKTRDQLTREERAWVRERFF